MNVRQPLATTDVLIRAGAHSSNTEVHIPSGTIAPCDQPKEGALVFTVNQRRIAPRS